MDGQSPAFVRTLADMPVEEMLSRNGDAHPLSVLMDAMLPSSQGHGVLSDLWGMLCSTFAGGRYGATKPDGSENSGNERAQRQPMRSSPVKSGSTHTGAEDPVLRRDRRIPAVIECIGIVADKIEQARLASMRKGRVTHATFVSSVEKFLQQEHGCTRRCSDGVTEVRRSFIYMLCLQYLMSTGNVERQDLIFRLVKTFLLRFSRYALDTRGARAIHYALSLCGGKQEEEFIHQIIRPLIALEARRFRTECTDISFVDTLKDKEGNGPLHYALSSVYCSESAIRYVLLHLDRISTPGDPALLHEFLAGIPYYALFYSLSESCERSKLAFRRSNAELRHNLGWLQGHSGPRNIDLHAVAGMIRNRVENANGIAARARIFNARFCNILHMLRAKDTRIRNANVLLQHEGFAPIEEFFTYCRRKLSRIRTESDVESCLLDDIIRGHLRELFSFRRCERSRIGAGTAVHELVEYVLSDNAYVRRVSICADYTRRLFCANRAENNTDGWEYDTYTMVVSSFFAMVCSMCKLSSRVFTDHAEVCSSFLEAKRGYAREHRMLGVFCYFFPSVGSIIFVCALAGIVTSSGAPLHTKMWQIFGTLWATILLCTVLYTYCALEKAEVVRRTRELERNLENYILGIIRCGEDTLKNAQGMYAVPAFGTTSRMCDAPVATNTSLRAVVAPSGERVVSVESATRRTCGVSMA